MAKKVTPVQHLVVKRSTLRVGLLLSDEGSLAGWQLPWETQTPSPSSTGRLRGRCSLAGRGDPFVGLKGQCISGV